MNTPATALPHANLEYSHVVMTAFLNAATVKQNCLQNLKFGDKENSEIAYAQAHPYYMGYLVAHRLAQTLSAEQVQTLAQNAPSDLKALMSQFEEQCYEYDLFQADDCFAPADCSNKQLPCAYINADVDKHFMGFVAYFETTLNYTKHFQIDYTSLLTLNERAEITFITEQQLRDTCKELFLRNYEEGYALSIAALRFDLPEIPEFMAFLSSNPEFSNCNELQFVSECLDENLPKCANFNVVSRDEPIVYFVCDDDSRDCSQDDENFPQTPQFVILYS